MHQSSVALLIASAFGCSTMLLVILFGRLIWQAKSAARLDSHPELRTPLFWRLFRLPISMLILVTRPWLSVRARFSVQEQLKRADLDRLIGPEEFICGRLFAGLLGVMVAAIAWSPRGWAPFWLLVLALLLVQALPVTWLRDRIESRKRSILRELPFYLDVITLAVESGLNLNAALVQSVEKGPRGPLRDEFARLLSELRTGRTREQALRGLAERLAVPAVGSLVAALLVAEKQGASLGPVLRAQAEQRRTERFTRAEKLAMQAPIKMLPPLLLFIFPCTFAMLLYPVASRLIEEGWLR